MAILAQCVGNGPRGRGHLRAIVICLADTGMRKSELLTLEWSDVDLVSGVIRLRPINAKTGRAREIPMTPRVRAELSAMAEARTGPRLWPHADIRRAFATACRLAGVEDLHVHDLRHAFVTRSILAGIPQAMVLKASGHVSDDEWKRYLNVGPSLLRRLIEPHGDQPREDVREYARAVLRGLKTALLTDEVAELLAGL